MRPGLPGLQILKFPISVFDREAERCTDCYKFYFNNIPTTDFYDVSDSNFIKAPSITFRTYNEDI